MRRNIFISIVIIAFSFNLTGKVVRLPDLNNPESIVIDDDKAYVVEKTSVYIYSLKDFTLIKKFGKPGAGPGEFKAFPGLELELYVTHDNLVVNSMLKVSFYSKDGELLKEIKKKFPSFKFKPLGSEFVSSSIKRNDDGVQYELFSIYTLDHSTFVAKKDFFKTKGAFQSTKATSGGFNPLTQFSIKFQSGFKRVFVSDLAGVIRIFDQDGNALSEIKPNYGKLDVTEELKKNVFEYYRNHPALRRMFEAIKGAMKFPEVFPDIHDFRVSDKMLYVLPFARHEGKKFLFVFNLDGKLVKKVESPLKEFFVVGIYPYTIEKGKVYQLVENEEEEAWEIHVNPLK